MRSETIASPYEQRRARAACSEWPQGSRGRSRRLYAWIGALARATPASQVPYFCYRIELGRRLARMDAGGRNDQEGKGRLLGDLREGQEPGRECRVRPLRAGAGRTDFTRDIFRIHTLERAAMRLSLTTGFSTGDGEIHRKIRENLFPERLTWPKNLIYSPDVTGALSRRKSGDSRVCPLI
jgi:hypothetical protein